MATPAEVNTTDQFWTPENDPVDTVIVQGLPLPGFCEPVGAGSLRKIQVQEGPGFSGARYLFQGMAVPKFSIIVHLQDEQDLFDWEVFKVGPAGAFVKPPVPKPGGALNQQGLIINPYTIYHPYLAELGITSVIVEDVGQRERDGDTGGWKIEIKVIKYTPIKKMSAAYDKPKGAAPDERDQRNLAKAAQNNEKRAALAALQGTPLPAPK